MPRKFLMLVAGLLLLASLGCQPAVQEEEAAAADPTVSAEDEAEAALQAAREAYQAAESAEEKIGIARDYLTRFPESDSVPMVLGILIDDLTGELDRPDAAYELVQLVLDRVEDPDLRFEVQVRLAVLHGKTGKLDELRELTAKIAANRELGYNDRLTIAEMAAKAEVWDLVLDESEASLAQATPEAWLAENPEVSLAETRAPRFGKRRRGVSLAYKGWALVNLGREQEGVATFREAEESTTYHVTGFAETPVYRFWGRTLIRQGDPAAAVELLVPEALWAFYDEGREILNEAWVAQNGSDEGLDDYLWERRLALARPLEYFSLPNYDDETVNLADFQGDVLLLVFWFPT